MNIPDHKLVELSKEKVHFVRTNVSGEVDSKGKFKPKITIEIQRETENGEIDYVKKLIIEQIEASRELLEKHITEMLLGMNN